MKNIQSIIEQAWESRDKVSLKTKGPVRKAVDRALAMLDAGQARVAEKKDGQWVTNQWLKKAVLLSFRLNDMELIGGGPGKGGVRLPLDRTTLSVALGRENVVHLALTAPAAAQRIDGLLRRLMRFLGQDETRANEPGERTAAHAAPDAVTTE